MHGYLMAVFIVVDISVTVFVMRRAFPGKGEFLDALKFWFQPWWLSALRGEWSEDFEKSIRILVAMFPTIGLILVEVWIFSWIP